MVDNINMNAVTFDASLEKKKPFLAQLGVSLCMMGIPLVGCNSTAAFTLFTVCMGTLGFMGGGTFTLPAVISPEFSGTVYGIANTFAAATGFIAPGCRHYFPSRFVVAFLSFWGLCIMYGLRVNLNIAIVAMVNSTVYATSSNTAAKPTDCPVDSSGLTTNVSASSLAHQGTFMWSQTTQGNILGAFFYGFIATHIIGGRISELTSPKWLFAGGILGSAVSTLLTPICAHWSVAGMVLVRVMNGIFQGVIYPALFSIVSRWIPKHERCTVVGVCMAGTSLGSFISLPLTSYLCEYGFDGGWPSSFYIIGVIGVLFSVLYVALVYDNPQDNPRITAKELNFIAEGTAEEKAGKKLALSWMKLLKSVPLWAFTVAKFSNNYAFNVIATKLPAYLDTILHQSIEENGLVNSMINLILAVTMIITGWMADSIRKKGYLGPSATCKIFEAFSQLGISLCMMGIPLVGCNSTAAITLFTVCMGTLGFTGGGILPLPAVISPEFSGTVYGIAKTFAAATGFIAPLVVGAILDADNGSTKQWSYVFYSTAALCAFGTGIFVIFGSGEKQNWEEDSQQEEERGYVESEKNYLFNKTITTNYRN